MTEHRATVAVKVVCAAVCAVTFLRAWPLSANVQISVFLLSPGKAGRIEVGMAVDEIYRAVGRERTRLVDLFREGMFDPALEIELPGSAVVPALVAPIREWPCLVYSVQGIRVRDPRFRTREGIGIGSTLGDLRKHYQLRLSDEEGPHAWVESMRMNFRLENGSRAESVRIQSIWLPGDPVQIRRTRCPERGPLGGAFR